MLKEDLIVKSPPAIGVYSTMSQYKQWSIGGFMSRIKNAVDYAVDHPVETVATMGLGALAWKGITTGYSYLSDKIDEWKEEADAKKSKKKSKKDEEDEGEDTKKKK